MPITESRKYKTGEPILPGDKVSHEENGIGEVICPVYSEDGHILVSFEALRKRREYGYFWFEGKKVKGGWTTDNNFITFISHADPY